MDSWIFKTYSIFFNLLQLLFLFEAQSYPFLISGSSLCKLLCSVGTTPIVFAIFSVFYKKQYSIPGIIHFPKKPWFLLVATVIRKTTIWTLWIFTATDLSLFSRPFQWTKLRKNVVFKKQIMSSYWIFHFKLHITKFLLSFLNCIIFLMLKTTVPNNTDTDYKLYSTIYELRHNNSNIITKNKTLNKG